MAIAALPALAMACLVPAAPAAAKAPRQLERTAPSPPLRGFDSASPTLGFKIPGGPGKDLTRARKLGANTVRMTLSWHWLEPSPGRLDEDRAKRVDRLIEKARKRHVGVLATALFTPCWATSGPRQVNGSCSAIQAIYPPRDYGAFRAFIKRAVNRWGDALAGLEVWNEPNLAIFWLGSAGEYVRLVSAAASGVEASHYRGLPVVGGAVSGVDFDFIRRALNAGMANYVDAISIHPYDVGLLGFGDPSRPRNGDAGSFAWAVPELHKRLLERGVQQPIWITEFGYADCPGTPYCVSQSAQADYLRKGAQLAVGWPWVKAFFVYRLRDWVPQTGLAESRYGVLNRDGSLKPAASALAGVFRAARAASR
jgi:hypothetical protein